MVHGNLCVHRISLLELDVELLSLSLFLTEYHCQTFKVVLLLLVSLF